MKGPEKHREVRLTYVPPQNLPIVPAPRMAPERRTGLGERAMLTVERALGGWARTLNAALALAGLAVVGLVVVAITLGIMPAVLGGLILLAIAGRPR